MSAPSSGVSAKANPESLSGDTEEGVFCCFHRCRKIRAETQESIMGKTIASCGARSDRTKHGVVSFRPKSGFSQLTEGHRR